MIKSLSILGSMLILASLGCGGPPSIPAAQAQNNPAGDGAPASEAVTPDSSPTAENGTTPDTPNETVASASTEDPAAVPTAEPREPAASSSETSKIEPAYPTVPLAGAPETAAQIDLTPYYQLRAAEFETYTSHPWKDVPRGSQTLGNVPLDIGGRVCLWGKANADKGQVFPEHVEGIRIGRKMDVLYLYHATFHHSPDGAPVVRLVLNYENDIRVEKELYYTTHLRDWYQFPGDPEELLDPRSKRVWKGINSMVNANPPWGLQFFITEITNPNPLLEVLSIDLHSTKGNSAYCLLAMTAGPPGLLKIEQEPAADGALPKN